MEGSAKQESFGGIQLCERKLYVVEDFGDIGGYKVSAVGAVGGYWVRADQFEQASAPFWAGYDFSINWLGGKFEMEYIM